MEAKTFSREFCIGKQTVLLPDYSRVDAVQLKSGLIVLEVIVTPEMAKTWLDNCANPLNRSIKIQRRNMYASDMESVNWDMLTTDNAITFDEDGMLKNGHHRLHSIVKSGVPIKMIVYLDASKDIKIFDKGGVRTTIDTLRMQGLDKELLNNNTVSVVKYLFKAIIASNDTISDFVVRAYLEKHSETILKACKISRNGGGECYCKNAQTMSVLYCALRYGVTPTKLEEFCAVANTGIVDGAGFTSALYFNKYSKFARDTRNEKKSSDRSIRNGIQLVAERALLDYMNGIERKRAYDPSKIKPGTYTTFVAKKDKEEVASLLGKV